VLCCAVLCCAVLCCAVLCVITSEPQACMARQSASWCPKRLMDNQEKGVAAAEPFTALLELWLCIPVGPLMSLLCCMVHGSAGLACRNTCLHDHDLQLVDRQAACPGNAVPCLMGCPLPPSGAVVRDDAPLMFSSWSLMSMFMFV